MPTKDEVDGWITWLRSVESLAGASQHTEIADMLAALQAEVERLKGELAEQVQWVRDLADMENAAQQARKEEVERLMVERDEARAVENQMVGIANMWQESAETSAADYHRALALNGDLLARAEAAEAAGREAALREASGICFGMQRWYLGDEDFDCGAFGSLGEAASAILALLPTPPATDAARVRVAGDPTNPLDRMYEDEIGDFDE